MGFTEQLKKARKKTKYTQEEVAVLIGVTKSAYCGYETGKRKPDVEKIKMICKVLKTSGDFLLETGFYKESGDDERLQEIVNAYNNLSEKGKAFLLKQTGIALESFMDTGKKEVFPLAK